MNLHTKQPGDTLEHALKWLRIDQTSRKDLKKRLVKMMVLPNIVKVSQSQHMASTASMSTM